jgi:hypothetical protein
METSTTRLSTYPLVLNFHYPRLVLTSCSCVVIPGWAGHPIGSFMAEDSPYLWILDGLGSDFPHLRVWTYGYGGSLTQQGSGEDVYEFADSFVRSLRRLRLGLGV